MSREANILINAQGDENSASIACKATGNKDLILESICQLIVEMEKLSDNPTEFRTLFLQMLNKIRKEELKHGI